jgi:asparagine synthase (glutamine-hydrolysing)
MRATGGGAGSGRAAQPRFFWDSVREVAEAEVFAAWDRTTGHSPAADVQALLEGKVALFGGEMWAVGMPPRWRCNPASGCEVPALHWTELDEFAYGDIKLVWELGRFAFVFALVRAYARTGDEELAELFWTLLEDWKAYNPPNVGPHWKCGQEVALRLMALVFGRFGFAGSPAATEERIASLREIVEASAERIAGNIGYAVSQKNNHAISEAVGLFTAGILFAELPGAGDWVETGRELLDRLVHELFYDDGSFVQHSANYQRLALHDYLWAMRLGDLNGVGFSSETKSRLSHSVELLHQLQEQSTGGVPHFGHNDGALILPLNNCDFWDFRPVVQSLTYLLRGELMYPPGPWDEDLVWLFGTEALEAPVAGVERRSFAAVDGGCYVLRLEESFAFVRCSAFRHRPAQADQLHVDLWWRGYNIAIDPGTFSYNCEGPWNDRFAEARYHNTLTVDGMDQMDRVGRFLWLPWAQGRAEGPTPLASGRLVCVEARHDGYSRLDRPVVHKRAIVGADKSCWVVIDRVVSTGVHRYDVHWLFADLPYIWKERLGRLDLQTDSGAYHVWYGRTSGGVDAAVRRADPESAEGWYAPRYYAAVASPSLRFGAVSGSTTFWTVWAPCELRISCEAARFRFDAGSWGVELDLGDEADADGAIVVAGRTFGDEGEERLRPCPSG